MSTSPDQIAIAPGYLQQEWTEGGRRYFHYTMDAPILDLLLLPLRDYEVREGRVESGTRWPAGGDRSTITPSHEYNLERMIEG